MILDSKDKISHYRLLTLKQALKLEILGLKRHGQSVYVILKEEFGFRGRREKVLKQLEDLIEKGGRF